MASDEVRERRGRAFELYLAGASYDAIAKACGYRGKSGAHQAVRQAMADRGIEPTDTQISEGETELARLDAMLTGLWGKARRGDVQAVDRVLKIGERRALVVERMTAAKPPERERTALDELTARRRASGRPDASDQARSAGGSE